MFDIHMHAFVETKNNNGNWIPIKGINPIYKDIIIANPKQGKEILKLDGKNVYEWLPVHTYHRKPLSYKTYSLFTGKLDANITPIQKPKGLPTDISKKIKQIYDNNLYEIEPHDANHLTLRELVLDYNWEADTNIWAYIGIEDYKKIKNGEKIPIENLYEIPTIEHVDNSTMEAIINGEKTENIDHDSEPETDIIISVKPKDIAPHFYYQVIPLLQYLGKPDNVRMIYWFHTDEEL